LRVAVEVRLKAKVFTRMHGSFSAIAERFVVLASGQDNIYSTFTEACLLFYVMFFCVEISVECNVFLLFY